MYCYVNNIYYTCNKSTKMEKTIGINLELTKEFSLELDQYILDLKREGVKVSKADLIVKFARMQFNKEKQNEGN